MNVKLLNAVCEAIAAHPAHFDMRDYFLVVESGNAEEVSVPKGLTDIRHVLAGQNECNTAGCIAGWAAAISKKRISARQDFFTAAADLLKLDTAQADRLFYEPEWPEQFRSCEVWESATPQQAIARIKHFVATDGAE